MTGKILARALAAGLLLQLASPGLAPAAPPIEPPAPSCGDKFPASIFGSIELGSTEKGRKVGKQPFTGAWALGHMESDQATSKWLEVRNYKGALPYGLTRTDNLQTVRKKLAARFKGVEVIKSQDHWPYHSRVVTALCTNKIGMQQRFEVAMSNKGVMIALIVASDLDIYERDI